MDPLIAPLQWRAAIKQYDTSKKLTDEQVDGLLEAARLAPASYGLQTYSIVVVNDPAIRTQLRAAAWDQPQLTDASHLFVFVISTEIGSAQVEAYMQDIVKTRGVTRESLQGYADMISGSIASRDAASNSAWAARQAYLALGVLLTAAAVAKIDATPMEGFDSKKFDEILGLTAKGLTSVVIVALGERSTADQYSQMKKVRKSIDELIIKI